MIVLGCTVLSVFFILQAPGRDGYVGTIGINNILVVMWKLSKLCQTDMNNFLYNETFFRTSPTRDSLLKVVFFPL